VTMMWYCSRRAPGILRRNKALSPELWLDRKPLCRSHRATEIRRHIQGCKIDKA